MKKTRKYSVGTLLGMGLFALPAIVAHADEGVVIKDSELKNEDGTINVKMNEIVKIEKENDKKYEITMNDKSYSIAKENVLKTVIHKELSLSVQMDNVTLKDEPQLFGNVVVPLEKGEVVTRMKGVDEQGDWVKVKTKENMEGWVYKPSLKQNIKNRYVTKKAYIASDNERESSLFYGNEVEIINFKDGKYKVRKDGNKTFVSIGSIAFTEPEKRIVKPKVTGYKAEASASVTTSATTHDMTIAESVLAEARQHLGKPYVWGATGTSGFDCSGFTQYVLKQNGVTIPRVASDQARVGGYVEKSDLKAGDMVFFETYKKGPSHVGFYIGDNQFIHAGGDHVQISDLRNTYYAQRYLFAKRMF